MRILSQKEAGTVSTRELMESSWPKFMVPDPETMRYWRDMRNLFPEYQLLLFDGDKLVGMGNSLPLVWSGKPEDLPLSWPDTLKRGVENKDASSFNTLAGVNISIHADYRSSGYSRQLLEGFKALALEKGFERVIIPARPSFKVQYPLTPFETYIHWKREDGAPFDPWIRTHWRLGAEIVQPIHHAFTAKGTVAEWEQWTGMKFPESDAYVVPGALMPVRINVEQDIGVYDDPNVWVEYKLEA